MKVKQKTKGIGGSYQTERTEYLSELRKLGVVETARQLVVEMIAEVQGEVLPKWGLANGNLSINFSTTVTDDGGKTDEYIGVVTEFGKLPDTAFVTYSLEVNYGFKVLLDNTTTSGV